MENNNKPGNNPNNKRNNPQNKQTLFILLIASLVMMLLLSYMRSFLSSASTQKITYDEFIEKVENGEVESVKIGSDEITITPKESSNSSYMPITYYTVRVDDQELPDRLINAGVKFEQEETNSSSMIVSVIVSYILP
ncbi:MAG TPA: ATP-dependent metallopeptidase FtsH/Yme1/Tma family protein, partial [Lachnospiraceae bacterium]|nr:ATP-dependent metallopeptidase FtsH/Yme1/Tma family protein [Lachnospiraceae bacterium]